MALIWTNLNRLHGYFAPLYFIPHLWKNNIYKVKLRYKYINSFFFICFYKLFWQNNHLVLSENDPKFYVTIKFCVYQENHLSGFVFIRKTVYCVFCIVKTVYKVSYPIMSVSYPIMHVSYPILHVSYPIVCLSYPIIYHVKVNVAGTVA